MFTTKADNINDSLRLFYETPDYFWKWTPLAGTVKVTQGSAQVQSSQPLPLEEGERIRVGTDVETTVVEFGDEEDDEEGHSTSFKMKKTWKGPTTGK